MAELSWWQIGTIYQINVRSFMDKSGDGIGDIPGITHRLDYLHSLEIDAIWLTPIYVSPMTDCGYDVADYTSIDPVYGTFDDFDALLEGAHQRGIRVILDFVPNHTSSAHPWFLQSRASPANAKRDWYLWTDPAPTGGPPNNWLSAFGGPAWEWDEKTKQYYYHLFLKQQPDLNWRQPAVRQEIYAAMRFWLDRGVDGFRLDAIWRLIKDDRFRDNPADPSAAADARPFSRLLSTYTGDLPEVHEILAEIRALVDDADR